MHELVDFLQQTYCGSTGIEVEGVTDLKKLNWLRSRFEKVIELTLVYFVRLFKRRPFCAFYISYCIIFARIVCDPCSSFL